MQDRIKKMKKEIKPGLLKYMEKKDPGKSMSTYFELMKQVQEYKGWDAVLSAFQKWK